MNKVVISVKELSKLYRLGEIGTGTLSHDLNRWFARIRGKEDPLAKVGRANDRTMRAQKDEFVWALKDISFEVKQGEVLGIIGRNGAGKSTLLKILSRITAPTTGEAKIKGRIGSLLEGGTGFHQEMTGSENIFLNGTILGMTRREITKKLDDIVDFAGVAKYIDTPVKRYSSGMLVRLGFSVAAFLEPEILIVDEVLAVGDFEFQRRALGKIHEVSQSHGRTVLFVSHNMDSLRKLCSSGILLENGIKTFAGTINAVIDKYVHQQEDGLTNFLSEKKNFEQNNTGSYLLQAELLNSEDRSAGILKFGESFSIRARYMIEENTAAFALAFRVYNLFDKFIFGVNTLNAKNISIGSKGAHDLLCRIISNQLVPGKYYINIGGYIRPHTTLFENNRCIYFEIIHTPYRDSFEYNIVGDPVIGVQHEWLNNENH
jgi:lipopolysaccharide transport system ATP-binding protein